MSIIIGLGSGRCGTLSLAHLLNAQPATACFHEANPSCMAWEGADATVISLLRDFGAVLRGGEPAVTVDLTAPNRTCPLDRMRALKCLRSLGDVGSYYLPYVELILSLEPETRFPCLWRDKRAVVQSFVRKLRPRGLGVSQNRLRNHWAPTTQGRWVRDPLWDKCFPTITGLDGSDVSEYVSHYYDNYYAEANRIANLYPRNVRLFDVELLNSVQGRESILNFCLPDQEHADLEVRCNVGK